IKVIPDTLTLFDTWNGGTEIIITCDTPLTADTAINVKSPDGKIVGKLNVMKNEGVENNVLGLRMVYVKDASIANDIQNIDLQINKIGGYDALEEYLNKKCFNQALIQCKIYREDPKFGKLDKLDFRIQTLVREGVYDETKNKLNDNALSYFESRFTKLYPTPSRRNGIFIFMSSLDNISTYPKDANTLIMYADGISNNISTWSHEIGHVLGLLHTFLDKNEQCTLISSNDEIEESRSKINEYKIKLENHKKGLEDDKKDLKQTIDYKNQYGTSPQIEKNISILNNNIYTEKKSIEMYSNLIKNHQDKIEIIKLNNIRLKKVSTENIMDYIQDHDCSTPRNYTNNPNKRITFHKYQWDLMLKDLKLYL
ncbi:MAG: hypothetical protein ACK5IC_11010, partial [Moheibacter sp.]